MDNTEISIWPFIAFPFGLWLHYRPVYLFNSTEYLAKNEFKINFPKDYWLRYLSGSLLALILMAFILIAYLSDIYLALEYFLLFGFPLMAMKNSLIALIYKIYPIERSKQSTLYVIDGKVVSKAEEQLFFLGIYVLSILFNMYLYS